MGTFKVRFLIVIDEDDLLEGCTNADDDDELLDEEKGCTNADDDDDELNADDEELLD